MQIKYVRASQEQKTTLYPFTLDSIMAMASNFQPLFCEYFSYLSYRSYLYLRTNRETVHIFERTHTF